MIGKVNKPVVLNEPGCVEKPVYENKPRYARSDIKSCKNRI